MEAGRFIETLATFGRGIKMYKCVTILIKFYCCCHMTLEINIFLFD